MDIVLAIDPGVTSGTCLVRISKGSIRSIEPDQGKYRELELWKLLHTVNPAYLVAERFDYRNRHGDGLVLFSRNLLGVCQLWADLCDRHYRLQSAAEGKAYFTDDKLRALGVYTVGKDHARDATRHALYHLAFKSQLLSKTSRNELITARAA